MKNSGTSLNDSLIEIPRLTTGETSRKRKKSTLLADMSRARSHFTIFYGTLRAQVCLIFNRKLIALSRAMRLADDHYYALAHNFYANGTTLRFSVVPSIINCARFSKQNNDGKDDKFQLIVITRRRLWAGVICAQIGITLRFSMVDRYNFDPHQIKLLTLHDILMRYIRHRRSQVSSRPNRASELLQVIIKENNIPLPSQFCMKSSSLYCLFLILK